MPPTNDEDAKLKVVAPNGKGAKLKAVAPNGNMFFELTSPPHPYL